MKLSDLKSDVAMLNQGGWVDDIPDIPGLRLHVRPLSSPLYRRRQGELIRQLAISKRRDPAELEKIDTALIAEVVLIEWDGPEDFPYSKETASKLLADPEYQALRDAVMYAAAIVAERAAKGAETDAKN